MHTNLFAHINCLFKCSARFACISRLIHWLLKSADLHTCFLALLARDCTQTVNVRAFNVVEKEKKTGSKKCINLSTNGLDLYL